MPTTEIKFKAALVSAIEKAKDHVQDFLGDGYEITLVFHTGEGDPVDSGVVSTGDPTHALPAVADAAGENGVMEKLQTE